MGWRCNGCNKLCGIEHADPEVYSEEMIIEEDVAEISADVRLCLNSACCSEEVAEATLSFQEHVELAHEHTKGKGKDFTLSIEGTAVDRYEGKGRGQVHFYGAEVTAIVTCACGWKGSVTQTVEEQASSFESLA